MEFIEGGTVHGALSSKRFTEPIMAFITDQVSTQTINFKILTFILTF